MKLSRYKEIKQIVDNLNGIPKIKYLLEELTEEERKEFFDYKNFLEVQTFLTGIF